jgi:hypothetical protein
VELLAEAHRRALHGQEILGQPGFRLNLLDFFAGYHNNPAPWKYGACLNIIKFSSGNYRNIKSIEGFRSFIVIEPDDTVNRIILFKICCPALHFYIPLFKYKYGRCLSQTIGNVMQLWNRLPAYWVARLGTGLKWVKACYQDRKAKEEKAPGERHWGVESLIG